MKHNWASDGTCVRLGCNVMKTEANADADNCGDRAPFRSYLDDVDYMAQRIKEIQAEATAAMVGEEEQK